MYKARIVFNGQVCPLFFIQRFNCKIKRTIRKLNGRVLQNYHQLIMWTTSQKLTSRTEVTKAAASSVENTFHRPSHATKMNLPIKCSVRTMGSRSAYIMKGQQKLHHICKSMGSVTLKECGSIYNIRAKFSMELFHCAPIVFYF